MRYITRDDQANGKGDVYIWPPPLGGGAAGNERLNHQKAIRSFTALKEVLLQRLEAQQTGERHAATRHTAHAPPAARQQPFRSLGGADPPNASCRRARARGRCAVGGAASKGPRRGGGGRPCACARGTVRRQWDGGGQGRVEAGGGARPRRTPRATPHPLPRQTRFLPAAIPAPYPHSARAPAPLAL
eukprot:2699985-Prymnesium_polylepis.1